MIAFNRSSWPIISLPQVIERIIDNRGRSVPTSATGVPLIATNCIKEDGLYPTKEDIRYVSVKTYNTWFRSHPESGDIIIVNKGTPGRVCKVPNPVDFCIAQDMVAIRPDRNRIDPDYLFAALRSRDFKDQVNSLHVGTLIPHLKKSDFSHLYIPYPPRPIQNYIGRIYCEISGKIDLNQRMNETLEAMASAIFKSWFVDFDPVVAKAEGRNPPLPNKPIAALFPDSFDAEQPTSWSVRSVGDVISYINRGLAPAYTDHEGILVINQKCIRNRTLDLSKARFHDPKKRSVIGRIVQPGDILVNSTGVGTLGRVAQVWSVEGNMIVDTHVTIVRANSQFITPNYLGMVMLSREADIAELGEGSTGQTELGRERIKAIELIVPPLDIQNAFDSIVVPLRERIHSNERESRTLASLRDLLLPKLLSGEIPVRTAENMVEEVM